MNYIERAKEAGRAEQTLREAFLKIGRYIRNTAAALFFPIHGFYVYWTDRQEMPEVREKIILIAALGMIFLGSIAVFTYFREWPHVILWVPFYILAGIAYWLVYFFGPWYYMMDERR